MGKIYNVIFNSSIAGASSTNNESFFFDWSQLEEGRYKVSWTFIGGVNTVTAPNGQYVANLFIDLGQGAYTTIASSNLANQGATFSANYIGSLEVKSFTTATGSSAYYYAGTTTNPPFFLDNRPRNNNISIVMYSNTGTQGTAYTPISGPYTLTMQFKKED